MARYGVTFNKPGGLPLGGTIGSLYGAPGGSRRFAVYDICYGSDDTPGDMLLQFNVYRVTGADTLVGSPVIPQALDLEDPSAFTLAVDSISNDGSQGTFVSRVMDVSSTKRQTFRWFTSSRGVILGTGIAGDGISFKDSTQSGVGGQIHLTATIHFEER